MMENPYVVIAIVVGVALIIAYGLAKNRRFRLAIKDWFTFETKEDPLPPARSQIDLLNQAKLKEVETGSVIGREGTAEGGNPPADIVIGKKASFTKAKLGDIVGERIESREPRSDQ